MDRGELTLSATAQSDNDRAALPPSPDIPALCSAVRRGDESAVRSLHALYHNRLSRYALVITRGNEAVAADAVQNTFLKALRSLRPLPDEPALWAWLARACRSSASDESRRSRRYSALLAKLATLFSPPDPTPPEDSESIWQSALQLALANLTDSDRALLDDRYTHRRSLASIATATGSSERAIEGRLARLRHHLRQSILSHLASRPHEP